ncbi:MAG: hypothetical protein A3E01_02970 [Gammaproteobacteria bacterium RIFCSPHIGHO2_12_FULL_63_22]|nr:MAG: hypothetical protein A3E01_02970 [Gammaproteobacteria bacterium RIFCSPHIGHO2_12_FULL_63_22]
MSIDYGRVRAIRLKASRQEFGGHTRLEWLALLFYEYGRCVCCCTIPDAITKDHIIPLNFGGADTIENIQPLCARCNASKRDASDYRSIGAMPWVHQCMRHKQWFVELLAGKSIFELAHEANGARRSISFVGDYRRQRPFTAERAGDLLGDNVSELVVRVDGRLVCFLRDAAGQVQSKPFIPMVLS